MQSSHAASAVRAVFDEANLVAYGGLVPVMRLAERARLSGLVGEAVRIGGASNSGGANPAAKVGSLIAAMCAGTTRHRLRPHLPRLRRALHGSVDLPPDGTPRAGIAGPAHRASRHGRPAARLADGVARRRRDRVCRSVPSGRDGRPAGWRTLSLARQSGMVRAHPRGVLALTIRAAAHITFPTPQSVWSSAAARSPRARTALIGPGVGVPSGVERNRTSPPNACVSG
jgi:hypothetical protein